MNDIKHVTDVLRQFAEHKRQQAESLSKWTPGKLFRSNEYEKIRRLQLEARDLIGYADEIMEWWKTK